LSVELDEPKAATPLVHEEMPKEMAQHIFTPSDQLDPAYTAPVTRQWPLARELPVTLLIRSMERIPGDREDQLSQGLIRAHLFSDSVSFADFSERDVLHVVIGVPGTDTVRVALWARRVDEAERGLIVSGVTIPMPSAVWARLERAKQQVFADARTTVYRALTHACDLYSLGMCLFRALLVHQTQSLEDVQRTIWNVLAGLEPLVQGLNPDDHWTVHKRVRGKLKEQGKVFAPSSTSISEFVWYDALIYGLRLVSRISDFSFDDGQEGRGNDAIPAALQLAYRTAEQLAEQSRVDLFEAGNRYDDLHRICDLALAERM
jgi:hypothetical protein